MSASAQVLRACEATTFEGSPLGPVECGEPGRWWKAPSGKEYLLCEHHEAVYSRALGGRA